MDISFCSTLRFLGFVQFFPFLFRLQLHSKYAFFFPPMSIVFDSVLGIRGGDFVMQSYPARALDRKLQVDWARDAREGPRVLMSLRVDFGPMG